MISSHWKTQLATMKDAAQGTLLVFVQPPPITEVSPPPPPLLTPPPQCPLLHSHPLMYQSSTSPHILNQVVQQISGLQDLRRVCSHFRWAYPTSVGLGKVQFEVLLLKKHPDLVTCHQVEFDFGMLQWLHI